MRRRKEERKKERKKERSLLTFFTTIAPYAFSECQLALKIQNTIKVQLQIALCLNA